VNEEAAAKGKEKYAQLCVACHGADAKGNIALGAPNLTDDIWLYGGSQKSVMESIDKGRSGRMPAHAEFLGEAKGHLLAAYVWSLSHSFDPEFKRP
jgi:cytochrome c oxidase cbb3-type subunit 3